MTPELSFLGQMFARHKVEDTYIQSNAPIHQEKLLDDHLPEQVTLEQALLELSSPQSPERTIQDVSFLLKKGIEVSLPAPRKSNPAK